MGVAAITVATSEALSPVAPQLLPVTTQVSIGREGWT